MQVSARPALLSFQLELPAEPPAAADPVLPRLLGRARSGAVLYGSAADWLLARLTGQTSPNWLVLCQHAGAPLPPGTRTALRLEGVVLAASMNSISMQRAPASVEAADLAALQGLLADAFADYGGRLVGWNGLLLACFEQQWQLRTASLAECAGRELRECLPQGENADTMRRLMTECQMVLHAAADPLRSPQGGSVRAVNGIWLSGDCASTPSPSPSPSTSPSPSPSPSPVASLSAEAPHLRSTLPWLQALADSSTRRSALADTARQARQAMLGDWANAASWPGDAGLLIDCIRPGQAVIWHGPLAAPELPALLAAADRALLRGQITGLEIGLWRDSIGRGRQFQVGPWQRRQFWRAPQRPWLDDSE